MHHECKENPNSREVSHPNDGTFIPMRTNNPRVEHGRAPATDFPPAARAPLNAAVCESKLK